MSASWDSERMRPSRPAFALALEATARAAHLARVAFLLLLALAAWMLAYARPAGAARHDDDDTARVTHTIRVDDRGVIVDHSGRHVVVGRNGRVRVSVDPSSGDVDVDGSDLDSLDLRGHGVTVGRHGVVIDTDEDAGMVRMFSDAEVRAGEKIDGDVVAVFGDVHVEGQITGNVVAVFGSVRLEPGARIDGDAVAVGGVLQQPAGAIVGGESVSLGFLPIRWGAPTLGVLIGVVFVGWLISLLVGWILFLLLPGRMLRTAITASRRTGGSLVLGLLSGPLLIIAMVLLLITVIGIPIAFLLPIAFLTSVWAGQLALTYALGCRLLKRRLGEGSMMSPLLAGTLFVATFFVLGTILGRPEGVLRTIALFFDLLGFLLVVGLSVIGIGAFLLSRLGTRPRETEAPDAAPLGGLSLPPVSHAAPGPPSPYTPPATPAP